MSTATSTVGATPLAPREAILRAIADDLELIALLHDREPSAALVDAMRACPLADQLTLRLAGETSWQALEAMRAALADLPTELDAATLDTLAVGYADVYLRHVYRAAPTESVWTTEDGLDRQGAMLDIRAEHAAHGLRMTDAAARPEDHLVMQLRFVAQLLAGARADPEAAAHFLDAHLLRWIHLFAARLVHTGAPPLFAAVAVLTACYLDEARRHLAALTDVAVAKPAPLPDGKRIASSPATEERPYLPGAAPSW